MAQQSDCAAGGFSSIEQFSEPESCTTPNRPFLRGVNHDERRAVFFRPRCKMWACPYCAEVNKKLWTFRAFHGAAVLSGTEPLLGNTTNFASAREEFASSQCAIKPQDSLMSFLTLTSHRDLGPAASTAVFGSAWNNLLRRARHSGSQGQYFMVPERHKDGRLHAHAIETFNLGTRWWKDNAAEVGLGYIAEEAVARSAAGAAYYAGKYLAKSLDVATWPRGWRRVRTSRGWPKAPDKEQPPGWVWLPLPRDETLAAAWQRLEQIGYTVVLLDHDKAWNFVGGEI